MRSLAEMPRPGRSLTPSPSTRPVTRAHGPFPSHDPCPDSWRTTRPCHALSTLGKTFLDAIRGCAQQNGIKLDALPEDPNADIPPDQVIKVLRSAAWVLFPLLAPGTP